MKITEAMRQYAKAKGWVGQAATDDEVRKALADKMASGELTPAQLQALTEGRQPDANPSGTEARAVITGIVRDEIKGLEDRLVVLIKNVSPPSPPPPPPPPPPPSPNPAGPGNPPPPDTPEEQRKALEKLAGDLVNKTLSQHGLLPQGGDDGNGRITPVQMLSRAAAAGWAGVADVRVKSAVERYSDAKSNLVYPGNHKNVDLRGRQVTFPCEDGPCMGRPLESVSQRDKAIIGAWFKFALHSAGETGLARGLNMTEHDWDLIKHAIHEMPWTGMVGGEEGTGVDNVRLSEVFHRGVSGIKAILDDSTSGGINAAPQVVENAIIQVPLLFGELFPFVTVINLARGRRITGPTMGTPTITSGTAEGTEIGLFDTTGFIGSLDTTIFPAVGAMEIGLDFEEDSPVNIGNAVVARYGQAALVWLDRVIADGDGVSEPKGIFQTTGATTVNAGNGAAGPLTVADAEALMFGVNKAYRTSRGGRNVLIGNEVAYRRFRQIPTGTDYNTRVFGEAYGDYQVLGHPFKIITTLGNNEIAYANLGYYRMYRRLGLTVKVETGGKELSRKNLKLIVVRMRYGGQMEQAGAVALMTDAAA